DMVLGLPESLYSTLPEQLSLVEPSTAEQSRKTAPTGSDLVVTDAAVLSWLRERMLSQGMPEQILIVGLISRRWYKRLWTLSRETDTSRWDEIVGLWDRLGRDQRVRASREFEDEVFNTLGTRPSDVTGVPGTSALELLHNLRQTKSPWLLIDVPGGRP